MRSASTRAAQLSLFTAAVAMLPLVGRAAVVNVVNDRWADADRTAPAAPVYSENGVDADLDGDIESAWYNGGTSATATASAGNLRFAPAVGGTTSASWTTHFTPEATPVTLAAAGDSVRVRWVFTPRNVNANNTSQNFRVALVDTPAAGRLTAEGAPGNAAYTGYSMFMNMGQTLGNSNPFRIEERNVTTVTDLLGTSGNWVGVGTTGAASGQVGYASDVQYTFDMTIARNATNGVDITSSMSGGAIGGTGTITTSFTDATPNSFVYDTFAIRVTGATTTADAFDTSQFQVIATLTPEPASLTLLAAGAVAGLRRRR